MADHLLAEALARIEYKQDLILRHLGVAFPPQLEWMVQPPCPACGQPTKYEMDIQHQVVKRICGCKTGKQPFIVPNLPTQQGASNGRASESSPAEAAPGAADRPGRQEGRPVPGHVR